MASNNSDAYGILRVNVLNMLDVLKGKKRYNIPEGVTMVTVHEDYASMSLEVLLRSDEAIEGVTYTYVEGADIPLAEGVDIVTVEDLEHTSIQTDGVTEELVTVPKSEYDRLLDDEYFLTCLIACGVDNWQGYSDAWELYSEGIYEE